MFKRKKYDSIEYISETLSEISGVTKRSINVNEQDIFIYYISQLTDYAMLSDSLIRPIMESANKSGSMLTAAYTSNRIISIGDCKILDNDGEAREYILKGFSIIVFSGDCQYIAANTKKVETKSIPDPELTYTLRGPRDSFTENLDVNLSLIRYRIKDPALKIEMYEMGERTRARVGMVYIGDIANEKYVKNIKERLSKLRNLSIFESGYLQKYLLNKNTDIFPQMGMVERSDMACAGLLEGRIIIITEGSGIALVAPVSFWDFLKSGDDIYDNAYLTFFVKILRIFAIYLTLTISSVYVAIVSFNPEILPTEYVLTIAKSRATVPFNALFEAIVMELVAEIIREAIIRLPKQIGPAIGIAGAIVIGQAAVAAGIFSPLMIIFGSMALVCSFIAPDYTIITPLRILKFMMIFLTGLFGLFGLVMGLTLIVVNVISNNSFGMPYLTPFAPWNAYDIKHLFLSDLIRDKRRPVFLNNHDKTKR